MKKSRFTDSQIIAVLKQAEAGTPVPELCREHGISSATFYKWRSKYGGMEASMVSRIHVPPPPPNQIVHVKMPQATKLTSMYEPVWVIGKLSAQSVSSELADAAYSIAGTKIEKYEER